jgi:hypothetical protein
MLQDSPQCVGFGLFMIWFASITVNLGPTFLRQILITVLYVISEPNSETNIDIIRRYTQNGLRASGQGLVNDKLRLKNLVPQSF